MAACSWKDWWGLQPFGSEPRVVEQTLIDAELGLTGTPDFYTTSELFDWKVSKKVRWTHLWQAIMYLELIRRTKGLAIPGYRIILLHPDLGEWTEVRGLYSAERVEAYLGLKRAYELYKKEVQDGNNVTH